MDEKQLCAANPRPSFTLSTCLVGWYYLGAPDAPGWVLGPMRAQQIEKYPTASPVSGCSAQPGSSTLWSEKCGAMMKQCHALSETGEDNCKGLRNVVKGP